MDMEAHTLVSEEDSKILQGTSFSSASQPGPDKQNPNNISLPGRDSQEIIEEQQSDDEGNKVDSQPDADDGQIVSGGTSGGSGGSGDGVAGKALSQASRKSINQLMQEEQQRFSYDNMETGCNNEEVVNMQNNGDEKEEDKDDPQELNFDMSQLIYSGQKNRTSKNIFVGKVRKNSSTSPKKRRRKVP